jgi:3-oxoacyl-[acyl-carrier-protein] synthase II
MHSEIQGYAWRTPLGCSIDAAMERLRAGEAAGDIHPSDSLELLTARIAQEPAPSKHRRFLRRMGLFAVEVAHEAVQHAQSRGCAVSAGDRLGLFFGYGGLRAHWNDMMPALMQQRDDLSDSWELGFKLIHPFWMLQHLSNNAQALVAQDLDARGEGLTFGGANAGAQAIAAANRALHARAVDVALVVAYDTLLEPETLLELHARGAFASAFIPGEGAAAMVLTLPTGASGTSSSLGAVAAVDGADGEAGLPRRETIAALRSSVAQGGECTEDAAGMGELGAAMPVVQAIALAERLRYEGPTHGAGLGIIVGAPGLVGVVRVRMAPQ